MSDSPFVKKLTLGEPVIYRIEVQGRLDERWFDRLGGMCITKSGGENRELVTRLEGRVRDQAELAGVLNSLYEMHMPILSVEIVNE